MILIITKLLDDTSVIHVRDMLQTQGAEVMVVGPETMEKQASFRIQASSHGRPQALLRIAGHEFDLAKDITSAWIWRSWRPEPLLAQYGTLIDHPDEWNFFSGEWAVFYKSVTTALQYNGVFCVNPPPFHDAFEEKCAQLWIAADVGLHIPSTLYTAHLPYAKDFYDEHSGSIIYKPFRPFFKVVPTKPGEQSKIAKLLTNRVSAQHFERAQNAVPTPGIFQPYVEKQFEIRIVVIGRELFACAIDSQNSERSREDWRRYDIENTPYTPYDLPTDLADKIRRYMDRLGLVFGSIDMIVTPEGDHVFLEINPNGQFDWIAQLSGLPIYQHLAAMLRAGSIDYKAELDQHEVIHAE